ncbi:MAG: hypothetical protein ACREDT_16935, partial [Methylocella sp.]
ASMALWNNRICGASIRMKKSNDWAPAGECGPRSAWVTPVEATGPPPPRETRPPEPNVFSRFTV